MTTTAGLDQSTPQVDADELLEMYRRMVRIRHFEQSASRLYADTEIPGFLHLSIGQEATAVGACWHLRDDDGIFGAQLPPGGKHLLGTTVGGYDVFSRVIWGSQTALSVIVVAVILSIFLGVLLGTLIGVAKRAGLLPEGRDHANIGLSHALMADSTAIVAGSLLGTSSTTAYVESAAGVQAGGRSGLTALTVAVLFLAATFLAPLAGSVPAQATAPALIYVATLMLRELAEIDWQDVTEAAPAVLTALAMPFTYSIANGLAFGFVSYAGIKLLSGRAGQVHPATWIIAALFVIRFVFFPAG